MLKIAFPLSFSLKKPPFIYSFIFFLHSNSNLLNIDELQLKLQVLSQHQLFDGKILDIFCGLLKMGKVNGLRKTRVNLVQNSL